MCAHRKLRRSRPFPRIGRQMQWCTMTKKNSRSVYRNGVFIAFHGSWNRAPYPQGGYNVVFQPMVGDHAAGRCEIFADGFAGAVKSPDKADHRPSGLAVGPDGALYVSDDVRGRIYRIVYRGGSAGSAGNVTPCPSENGSGWRYRRSSGESSRGHSSRRWNRGNCRRCGSGGSNA